MALPTITVTPGAGATVNTLPNGGQAIGANSLPVVLASDVGTLIGTSVKVIPTVTAGAYTAGNVVGGIMTFASALPASFGGTLQSLSLTFKGSVLTTALDVAVFSASPAGTFADHGAPAIAAADSALLLGVYSLQFPLSNLGTHTIYNVDGIGKRVLGASTSLFVVVTTRAAITPASTTDMALTLGMQW